MCLVTTALSRPLLRKHSLVLRRRFIVPQRLFAVTTKHAQESHSANQRRALHLQVRKSHSPNLSMFTQYVSQ